MGGEFKQQSDKLKIITDQIKRQERVKPWPEPSTGSGGSRQQEEGRASNSRNSEPQNRDRKKP